MDGEKVVAARIVETDFGSKGATKRKIEQLQRDAPKMFDRLLFRYWQKVYSYAVRECPVDTAALRATIRIQKGRNTTGRYVVGRGDRVSEYYILAGGGGVINPRHKREVDYARAVHDGTSKQPANPFLDRAMMKAEKDYQDFIRKYLDWFQKTWSDDQPVPTTWNVPLPVSEYQSGLEGRR